MAMEAKRPFSPIFVDFYEKAQKSNQIKAGIGIAHQFYIEKGISGMVPEIFFYLLNPPNRGNSAVFRIF